MDGERFVSIEIEVLQGKRGRDGGDPCSGRWYIDDLVFSDTITIEQAVAVYLKRISTEDDWFKVYPTGLIRVEDPAWADRQDNRFIENLRDLSVR